MFRAASIGWIRTLFIGALLVFGVSATAQTGTGSVTLAWTDTDPTVVGYDVYYGTVSGTYTNEVNVGDVTNATISGLEIGVTYYFAVAAYNSNDVESSLSGEVSYTVTQPAPTVTLTAPANGAAYLAPATIVLNAAVTTNGNTINGVQFYNGTTLLGTDSSAPYTFTWSGVGGGNYSLSAQVDYNSGSIAASTAVSVSVTNPPPAIALTAPANGSSYLAPATISLTAGVTVNGHTINQVQFYNGSTLLGTVTAAPYTYTWSSVAAGSYTLSAKLGYDSGSTLTSGSVAVTVTNPLPAIALTAPANGSSYLAPATINLSAGVTTNGHTITQVQFYNGSTLLGTVTAAPYTYTWSSVAVGSYTLSAKLGYDSGSTLTSGSVAVTVTNTLPVITMTAPANGSSYLAPATINLSAGVITNGHTINQVQFYNGSTLLGTVTAAPYTYAWSSVAAGSYTLSTRVGYDSGSTSSSGSINVTVTNPAPVVTMTAPANGSSYAAPATINLSASVTANGNTISSVQFYNGASLVGSASSAPYTYAWSGVAAGSYSLSAQAVYGSGSTASSGAINVTVTNLNPTIVLTTPTNGANYAASSSVNLLATVNANGHAITKVSFFNGASLLGSVTTAPYSYSWNNVAAGTDTVSAQLTYDSGSTLTTSSASIVVHPLPTISAITNQNIAAGNTNPPILFTVSDPETGASNLTLTASSDNPAVVSGTNIVFGGAGTERTATITSPGPTGSANVTITVSYGVASASTTFQLTVVPSALKPTAPTIISVNGPGSVTPNLNGQALTLGQSYTVTATPAAGQTFTGWSGSVNSTNSTITFVLTSGFSLTANFERSPYAKTSGSFSGLFYETNQTQVVSNSARSLAVNQVLPSSAGAFGITVGLSGVYSGHFQIGNKRYSFSGYLSDNGTSSQSIQRRGASALVLNLTMGTGTAADQVYGTISDGAWTASIVGHCAVFDGRKHVAPFQGRYTMVFPGQDGSATSPAGDGYGAVHVTGSGLAIFAGKLADGTPVSQSAQVSAQGNWPLYVPLYAGNGLLTGWMNFTNDVADDLSGATTWVKPAQATAAYYPAGFTNEFETVGSVYAQAGAQAPVLTLTNGMVSFSGGALGGSFTNGIAIVAHNKVTDLSGNPLRLTFIPGTGLFSGKVEDPSTPVTLSFGGAVFQKVQAGYGFLLDAGQSSEVVIGNE